jgi:hypothetical protein
MNSKTELNLQKELESLKSTSKLGFELDVAWRPDKGNPLAGEVINKTIQIYESDESKAITVLHHEFIDYAISQAIRPYKSIANTLVKLVNSEAYASKEEIVEGLIRLLAKQVRYDKEEAPNERNN